MCQIIIFSLTIISLSSVVCGTEYFVELSSNGPVVRGANITFTAKLYTTSGEVPTSDFEYYWEDNALNQHTRKNKVSSAEDKWTLAYPADIYPPGPYEMQVTVYRCFVFCYVVTSRRIDFNITAKLNGQMNLIQDNNVRPNQFISNNSIVTHAIVLSEPDYNYLEQNATSILTYWFIDCGYYGMTTNFSFTYKYDKADSQHVVEALVVAGFEPITTPAPTTTTTTSTTTTTTPSTTTTSTTSTTTPKSNIATETITINHTELTNQIHKERAKRAVSSPATLISMNGSIISPDDFPYVCLNQTNIAPDPKKAYGYFAKQMIVKAPVANLTVTGNNWLQHGDMLSLGVKCSGSSQFSYCMNFITGLYNITGNETCDSQPETVDKCEFSIGRYYTFSGEFTILIIIKNDVSKIIYPVTVNVYKVTKRPQLSVIVVPVSFSLVAVVLIVFGMAYYIQNQRRFTVEVADFDFGQNYSDMEYKTFRERLRDSITNALTRTPTSDQSDPPVWPVSSRKYGSMT